MRFTLLGVAIVVAGLFLPAAPIKGWVMLAAFAMLSIPCFIGPYEASTKPIYRAQGWYMAVCALTFPTAYLWRGRPEWAEWATAGVFTASALWMTLQLARWRKHAMPTAPAGGTIAMRRLRIVRFATRLLFVALIPLLLVWMTTRR